MPRVRRTRHLKSDSRRCECYPMCCAASRDSHRESDGIAGPSQEACTHRFSPACAAGAKGSTEAQSSKSKTVLSASATESTPRAGVQTGPQPGGKRRNRREEFRNPCSLVTLSFPCNSFLLCLGKYRAAKGWKLQHKGKTRSQSFRHTRTRRRQRSRP